MTHKKKFYGIGLLTLLVLVFYYMSLDKQWKTVYPETTGKTCTVFLIDGLDNEIFKAELNAGRLPTMKKLIEKSLYVKNGISSFPTMTGYGYYPFITGEDATASGILGLRWFDRNRSKGNLRNYVGKTHTNMNDDITDRFKNFFESSGEMYTASVNSYMNRGVKHSIITGWSHTAAKYEGIGIFKWMRKIPIIGKDMANDHFEHESEALSLAIRQLQKNPKFQWVTFPSPDAANHVSGTNQTYYDLIYHIDSLLGVFLHEVEKLGQQNDRMIAIVSDHGISDVTDNLDFCSWIDSVSGLKIERGKSVNIWSSELDDPLTNLADKDGYFVINGNLCAYLYMKNPTQQIKDPWKLPVHHTLLTQYPKGSTQVNIPEIIADNDKIELVIYRSDAYELTILNGHQKAVLKDSSGLIAYHPTAGNPLDYPNHLHHQFLSSKNWLDETYESNFPYAVPRIFALMNQPGIGDIVMTSRKGVDLASDYEILVSNYKGGHGGLRKEIITVPFILYRPGYPAEKIETMTNEDAGKVIKSFLGF